MNANLLINPCDSREDLVIGRNLGDAINALRRVIIDQPLLVAFGVLSDNFKFDAIQSEVTGTDSSKSIAQCHVCVHFANFWPFGARNGPMRFL